jgi:hypothetical protein
MIALLAGLCFKTQNTVCAPGSKEIDPIVGLVGGFVLVGLLGIIWLMFRGRRG